MTRRSRPHVRAILTLMVLLVASPLAAVAQEATPLPGEQSPAVTAPPAAEPVEGVLPQEEAPQRQQAPASRTSSQQVMAAQEEGSAVVDFSIFECENDDRAGEVDFFPFPPVMAATSGNTSDNCVPVAPDAYVEMYMVSDTDQYFLYEGTSMEVPPGTYTLAGWINSSYGESGTIELPASSETFVQVISYAPSTSGGAIEDGVGDVAISVTQCVNWDRASQLDFLIQRDMAMRSAATDCAPAPASQFSFTLVNADDPGTALSPTSANDSEVVFADVPSGTWFVSEASTGNVSGTFPVSNGDALTMAVVSYIAGPIDLYVEKVFCEDDTLAGTTEFTVDSPAGFMAMAEASTCYAVPPSGAHPSASITLTNTDTSDTYSASLDSGSALFDSVTAGTYIATETIDGTDISSDPFVVDHPGMRIRVINYIASDGSQPEPGTGFGFISGTIMYCSSSDRAEGDVDFIVKGPVSFAAAATSECEFGAGASGAMLALVPADPGTGQPDGAGEAIWTDGMFYWQDIIAAGTYVLGYTSPYTGETLYSEPFAIDHRAETIIDINVYAAPAFTTYLDVWKDICVDPTRAGTTSFQMISEEGGFSIAAIEEPSDCRYSTPEDGEYTYTLTNLDTGQSWTQTVQGGDGLTFDNLIAGAYTLTETHDGVTATSETLVLEPSIGQWHRMNVRNFIAERDWQEPPVNADPAYIAIFSYGCTNPNRDGGFEWFRYGQVQDEEPGLTASANAPGTAASDTSTCRPVGGADGMEFIAEPVGGGTPVEFYESAPGFFEQWDIYGIPTGDYIITETSTGASTGVVRVVGWTAFDLLLFAELPEATVTVNISSADPTIADTLPEGSTWSVTSLRDPAITFSGTFAPDSLGLPTSFTLEEPLTYGDYLVVINAEPTFLPYEQVLTVGPGGAGEVRLMQESETFSVVLQPVPPSPTPSPTPSPSPTATPGVTPTSTVEPGTTTTPGPTHAPETPGTTATPGSGVTSLPSTGGGGDGSESGAFLGLAAFGAVIAAAGGIAMREKRG